MRRGGSQIHLYLKMGVLIIPAAIIDGGYKTEDA
jgi:hypothetical protein